MEYDKTNLRLEALKFAREDTPRSETNSPAFWCKVRNYMAWLEGNETCCESGTCQAKESSEEKGHDDHDTEQTGSYHSSSYSAEAEVVTKAMGEILGCNVTKVINDTTGRYSVMPAITVYYDNNRTPLFVLNDKKGIMMINSDYYREYKNIVVADDVLQRGIKTAFSRRYKDEVYYSYKFRLENVATLTNVIKKKEEGE